MLEATRPDLDAVPDERPQTPACQTDDANRMRNDVAALAAAILASAVTIAAWSVLKNLIYNWDFFWKWYALDFDLPFRTGAFMNAALLGFAACMAVVAQPFFARLMNRPWEGRSETSTTIYWLGGTACAACLLVASSGSLPLEIASHLGVPVEEWGEALQISHILASILVYALAAGYAKAKPGLLAAVALSFAPLVALGSVFILLAVGIAFIAIPVLRWIGNALDEDDEWTDDDEEMLEDLLRRRERTREDVTAL